MISTKLSMTHIDRSLTKTDKNKFFKIRLLLPKKIIYPTHFIKRVLNKSPTTKIHLNKIYFSKRKLKQLCQTFNKIIKMTFSKSQHQFFLKSL